MTCIAGACHRGRVWLAGDSAITVDDGTLESMSEPKVWLRRGVAFGHAGPLRSGEVLRHTLDVPRVPGSAEIERYVQVELIPAIRKALSDDGCEADWGSLLLGVGPQLYFVDSDFGAYRPAAGYAVTGALSVGALVGLRVTSGRSPARRLEAILEAVSVHVNSVRPPFSIVHT